MIPGERAREKNEYESETNEATKSTTFLKLLKLLTKAQMSNVRETQSAGTPPLKTERPFAFLVVDPPLASTLQAKPALCSGSPMRTTPLTVNFISNGTTESQKQWKCRFGNARSAFVCGDSPELMADPDICFIASTVAAAP